MSSHHASVKQGSVSKGGKDQEKPVSHKETSKKGNTNTVKGSIVKEEQKSFDH
jgi:hypothetical protein